MKAFFLAALFLPLLSVVCADNTVQERLMEYREGTFEVDKASLEAIKEHDMKHILEIQSMLEDRKKQLEDHQQGRKLLSKQDHATIQRQIRNYSKKLEQLAADHENEEALKEKIQHLSKIHGLDDIDFDKTGLEG